MIDALGLPQSVLVLGGGSDIARAMLRVLIPRRTRTVLLAGRPGSPSMAETAREARALGATRVEEFAFDATDPQSIPAVLDAIWKTAGDIDVVAVAFGLLGHQEALEADPAGAVPLATVNYTAAVVSGLSVATHLRTQGHGVLVALSSVAGQRVRRANFVYGSSKAGMDGFYQGLGDALVGSGARVMIVRPGFVHTKMTAGLDPAPMATSADAVGAAIADGLARASDTVWAPAPLRFVMAAMRSMPRAVWRRMPG